jgi:glycosyltransferase involved in cell wall biosynthesis
MPKWQVPLYLKSARIRTPSSSVAEAVRKKCPAASPIVRVIPNQLTFPRKLNSLVQKERRILYTGRIHPEKGLSLLLAAFLSITNDPASAGWTLELVGPWSVLEGGGGDEYVQQLKAEFTHDAIRWHGPVHNVDELNAHYAAAAIFVYPSIAEKGETFGVSALEAMAWGAAIIVSSISCFHDFIEDEKNGLFFDHRLPDASKRIAELLRGLIRDPLRRSELANQAMRVWETHGPESVTSAFLEDFASICPESK